MQRQSSKRGGTNLFNEGVLEKPIVSDVAWTITDGKVGMDVQAIGVAEALGLPIEVKHVAPSGVFRLCAPWIPVDPRERIGRSGAAFSPPWPKFVVATGRLSIPYVRAVKKRAGSGTITVVLQDPKTGCGTADFIWVPQHDRLRGPNVFTTVTAPNSFSPQKLAALRSAVPAAIAALPTPRVAVFLGGDNRAYRFTDADCDRLAAVLKSIGGLGASFMISPSRRTKPHLVAAADAGTRQSPRLFWKSEGANPYADYLAHADALMVTSDSVNMVSEACVTGRPVHVFHPSGGSPKFTRFHEALETYRACRPLQEPIREWEEWSYKPLFSGPVIAAEILSRWPHISAAAAACDRC